MHLSPCVCTTTAVSRANVRFAGRRALAAVGGESSDRQRRRGAQELVAVAVPLPFPPLSSLFPPVPVFLSYSLFPFRYFFYPLFLPCSLPPFFIPLTLSFFLFAHPLAFFFLSPCRPFPLFATLSLFGNWELYVYCMSCSAGHCLQLVYF